VEGCKKKAKRKEKKIENEKIIAPNGPNRTLSRIPNLSAPSPFPSPMVACHCLLPLALSISLVAAVSYKPCAKTGNFSATYAELDTLDWSGSTIGFCEGLFSSTDKILPLVDISCETWGKRKWERMGALVRNQFHPIFFVVQALEKQGVLDWLSEHKVPCHLAVDWQCRNSLAY